MFTKLFWADTLERAVSTASQSILIASGGQLANYVVNGLEPLILAGACGFALAVLKALAAVHFTSGNSASLVVDNVKQK